MTNNRSFPLKPHLIFFDEIDSTNAYLKRELEQHHLECAAVWAKTQTHGRGRLGRSWLSPQGGLYFSIIFPIFTEEPHLIGIVVSTVIAETLRSFLQRDDIFLKWPNDILHRDLDGIERKLGGILSELVQDKEGKLYAVVGIGLNVNAKIHLKDDERALPPISLGELASQQFDLKELFLSLQRALFRALIPSSQPTLLEKREELFRRWLLLMATKGKEVQVYLPFGKKITGQVVGFSKDFALLVDTGQNIQEIHVGDCLHLR